MPQALKSCPKCPIWSHWPWPSGSLGYGGATTIVKKTLVLKTLVIKTLVIKTLVITTSVKLVITFKMALVITANIS